MRTEKYFITKNAKGKLHIWGDAQIRDCVYATTEEAEVLFQLACLAEIKDIMYKEFLTQLFAKNLKNCKRGNQMIITVEDQKFTFEEFVK